MYETNQEEEDVVDVEAIFGEIGVYIALFFDLGVILLGIHGRCCQVLMSC